MSALTRTVTRTVTRRVTRSTTGTLGIPLPPTVNQAAWYRFNHGITEAGAGVSQWDDQSGNGRHLLQATDTNRPAKQADGSILFDGVDNFLKAAAFTLDRPFTVYIRAKQITWTLNEAWWEGNVTNSIGLFQGPATTPDLYVSGAGVSDANPLALNTYGSVAAVFVAGANNTILQVGGTTITGTLTGDTLGGFTLGCYGNGNAGFSNIQVKEVVLYSAAHDATQRAAVIAYLDTL